MDNDFGVMASPTDIVAVDPNISRRAMISEIHEWCSSWQKNAEEWRRNNYEDEWHDAQRDADGIYDPNLAAKKQKWQAKRFYPLTPSHRETIQGQLYKMVAGARPPLEMASRADVGESDQSENIRDIILRELEKSRFTVEFNRILDDSTTYGSGFCRVRFEEKREPRIVKQPQYEQVSISDPNALVQQMVDGQKVIGYQDTQMEVVVYRGVRIDWLNIWDVFKDPASNGLSTKGFPVSYRFSQTYQDIVDGVRNGYYFEEAETALADIASDEKSTEDKHEVEADRGQNASTSVKRTKNARLITCYEMYARVPKKWVVLDDSIDDPEALVPSRIIYSKDTLICIEPSDKYDGEPPIYQLDYFMVNGQTYGRGIPKMLRDLQQLCNEGVNARQDYINLSMNKKFAVISKAMEFPNDDLNSDLGGAIRIDWKAMRDMQMNNVGSAIMEIPMSRVDQAAFINIQEYERAAQERTSVNRVTMGTAGQVRDQNDTLGGMQLLAQTAGDKFAYIGMLQEFSFLHELYRAVWECAYVNMTPEDVANAIGMERAMTFIPLTPEQIEKDYKYIPQGIFTQETKQGLQMRLSAVMQQFATAPWIDPMKFFDKELKTMGEDPENYKLTPDEMRQKMVADGIMNNLGQMPGPEEPGANGPNVGVSVSAKP